MHEDYKSFYADVFHVWRLWPFTNILTEHIFFLSELIHYYNCNNPTHLRN